MLSLTILGNNSAIAAYGRNPTAQVLQTADENFLIDCGEGTQNQLSKYKIKKNKIKHVFISHLHGDHYFGLIGLISSMGLQNRTSELHIHAPATLENIIRLQLSAADTVLPYEIFFHAIHAEGIIAETTALKVTAFKVMHRIDCWGFLFTEKKNKRKIDAQRAEMYGIPASFYGNLQQGEPYKTAKGTIVPNEEVTTAATPPKKYAYCADTLYDESIAEKVQRVDLLYHEATYLKDQEQKATARYHSTTVQAANIAKLANAKKLIIGHFSSKYEKLDSFLEESKSVFDNTELALEGVCYTI